jgi:AraC family transcriptional regulator, carnitine catabolism transcriptional activator
MRVAGARSVKNRHWRVEIVLHGDMRRVALVLLPELSNLGLASVIEPLFVSNWLAQRPLFEWRAVSMDGKPVRASNGAVLPVTGDLSSVKEETVFVLASFAPLATARSRALSRWLQQLSRRGVELGGIENGSLALAAAGLLDTHPTAIHWDNRPGFEELFPKVRLAGTPFSFTRNRVTCAGAAAILDMMIAWIAQHADAQIAEEVARHLLIKSNATKAAEELHQDDILTRARVLMQAHIEDPLSCTDLAVQLNISLRQLERKFQLAVGRTVHAEYRLVRIERAHQYLQQTDLSVTEVAALTGFSSLEYFSKVYQSAFAVRPSQDRRQTTDAPVFRRNPLGGSRAPHRKRRTAVD